MPRWRITWVCRSCNLLWVVRRARTLSEGGTCPACGGHGEMPWEVTGLLPPPAMALAGNHVRPLSVEDRGEANGHLDRPAAAELRRVIPL